MNRLFLALQVSAVAANIVVAVAAVNCWSAAAEEEGVRR